MASLSAARCSFRSVKVLESMTPLYERGAGFIAEDPTYHSSVVSFVEHNLPGGVLGIDDGEVIRAGDLDESGGGGILAT